MNIGAATAKLLPACLNVANNPSKENVEVLRSIIPLLAPIAIEKLQDNILLPLEAHLGSSAISDETKIPVAASLKDLLHRIEINDQKKFVRLYILLFSLLYDGTNDSLVRETSEEFKLIMIECTNELMSKAASSIIYEVYDKRFVSVLAPGIYSCIHFAAKEKLVALRLAALDSLLLWTLTSDAVDPHDYVLRRQAAEVVMFMLPGISQSMMRIMLGDDKQHHSIVVKAVMVWSRVISLVMEDEREQMNCGVITFSCDLNHKEQKYEDDDEEEDDSTRRFFRSKDPKEASAFIQQMKITPKWIKCNSKKLSYLIKQLKKLQCHSHWEVRQQLAKACMLLLEHCSANLQLSVIHFIEILIVLSEDKWKQVSLESIKALDIYAGKCESKRGKSLFELVEENFYCLLTKIPRIMRNSDEQSSQLNLLRGYLKLFGSKMLPKLLCTSTHLDHLVMALITVAELETNVGSVLETPSFPDLEGKRYTGSSHLWKVLKNFQDQQKVKDIEEICHLLGKFGDLDILSDKILEICSSSTYHRKEAIFVLNGVLTGASGREIVVLEAVVKNILEVFLDADIWYAPLTVSQAYAGDGSFCSNVKEAQSNLVQACLLVEGLGQMAFALGPAYTPFLLKTLYPVMERAGSGIEILSEAGMLSLQKISYATGVGGNITDLVQCNLDYLCHHVSLKLKHLETNPGVTDVLNVLMRHSSLNMLPALQNIIEDVFRQMTRVHINTSIITYLQVFYAFVLSLHKWLEKKLQKQETVQIELHTNRVENLRKNNKSTLVVNLIEYHKCKMKAEKMEEEMLNEKVHFKKDEIYEDENVRGSSCDATNEDVRKKSSPTYVKITVNILQHCLNYLPSKDRQKQLVVLATLDIGVWILSDYEDDLLPIVHLIWSPLVNRFQDNPDPLLMRRNFQLLCTLAKTAKSFIRSRTLQQVLSPICKYLSNSAVSSQGKSRNTAYTYTQMFKLQSVLLQNLGDLALDLGFQEKDLEDLMNSAIPYLSEKQPLELQESCVHFFRRLLLVDANAVWLKLFTLWNTSSELKHSCCQFLPIKISQGTQKVKYKKNIDIIFNEEDSSNGFGLKIRNS